MYTVEYKPLGLLLLTRHDQGVHEGPFSMADKVGIVAFAQTRFQPANDELEIAELVYDVVEAVLSQSGLDFDEDGAGIDATVSCSQDHWDGRTISSQPVCDVAGGHLRPEEKVAGDGAFAAYYAALQILSGHHQRVLVVAHCKESQAPAPLIENAGFDQLYHRQLGVDFTTVAGLQANAYMRRYAVTREQCAQVVVKNRRNARANPVAQPLPATSIDEVLAAPMVADPISVLDAKPAADGACALILASEAEARRLSERPVWLLGMGSCYDAHFPGQRALSEPGALRRAAKEAYELAGITEPADEIDLIELSEYYSYQELLWLEGLGVCAPGMAGELTASGATEIGAQLPVNPSGGLLSGVPVTVAGLNRVIEVARQLTGDAGGAQVSGARRAVAHGASGAGGQGQCVLVLGAEE